jgi:2-keto-4-pentenoate hydratase
MPNSGRRSLGLNEALRAQLERRRALLEGGADHVGWKLAFGIDALEAVLGERPGVGYLTTATQLRDGGTFSASGVRTLRAETEVAVVVGEGLAVALELVDVGRTQRDLRRVVEENVLHCAFAVGEPRTVEPERLTATLAVNGKVRDEADAARDFEQLLAQARELLEVVGVALRPGDVVLTGSSNHVPVAPGDHVRVEIAGLGALAATIRD